MAVGSELRIINLSEAKAAHDDELDLKDYKVRRSLKFVMISLMWGLDFIEFDSIRDQAARDEPYE